MRRTSSGRLGFVVATAAAVVLAVTLQPVAALARPKTPAWPADAVPGALLVTADGDASADRLEAATGGHRLGRTVVVKVRAGHERAAADALQSRPGVVAVEPDHLRAMLLRPNDPLYSRQWTHTVGRTPEAWDTTVGDRDIKVAVIDTGMDGTHPGLRPNIVSQVDVSEGFTTSVELGSDNDPCGIGHGTAVGGVLGAVGNDGRDIAGVAWRVGIVDVAAGDRTACGLFADSAVLAGIIFATNSAIDVINLSLGAPGDACPTAFQAAIDMARHQDIVVVAAAGNEQEFVPGLTSVPASCNGVISVGAVDSNGLHASYSNSNPYVDIAAPGGSTSGLGVLTTAHGGGTMTTAGTSFSAPFVAGAVVLLRAVAPALTPDDIESILESTTRTPGIRTSDLGWGLIDVDAAVELADSNSAQPPPAPDPVFPVGLVVRVSAQTLVTDPVLQAVAMSRYVYPTGSAEHAVLARRDDFADALTGSALSFGAGPILYTDSTGPLAAPSATELSRVLDPGAIVYLLGGTAALPPTLEDEVRTLGFEPRRLAGVTREGTGAVVADEVMRRVVELDFDPPDRVMLATRRNWPDAVTAGSFGAWFGYPILLTEQGVLSPETRDALARLKPRIAYVVGGTSVISDEVAAAASAAGGSSAVVRLAGVDRNATALAVAEKFVTEFRSRTNIDPLLAVGVNLRRADGFTHVLSAAPAIGAFSGVYLPIEGEGGDTVPPGVVALACRLSPIRGIVAGDGDVVSDAAKQRLNSLLEHSAGDCPTG